MSHIAALFAHPPLPPQKWPHPGICYVQPRLLPPSLLLLKESAQMEKNGRHLEGTSHVAPHSPALVFSLPVIIFVFV